MKVYPPASEASREVANLLKENIHIPPYMVSKNLSVCMSVRLGQTLTPIISGLAKQNRLKKFKTSLAK